MLLRTLETISQLIFLFIQRNGHLATIHQRTEQQFVSQWFFQVILDNTRHWTCAHCAVVAFLCQPVTCFLAHFQRDTFLIQLNLKLDDKLINNLMNHLGREMIKPDNVVEAVTEFRRKHFFDFAHCISTIVLMNQPNRFTLSFTHTGVGGHDQHHIAEIRFTPVIVGQRAVIHHLQQQVKDIRVCFFDFIQQQYRMRMLNNSIGQQTALVETDIPRRRTNQAADGVAFHIFGHIKTQQFNAECFGQLHRDFGLTDASWSGKQERTDRFMLVSQTGTAHFDRFSQRLNGFILSEYQHFQTVAQVFQRVAIALRNALLRDPRNAGHNGLDIRHVDGFLALADRHQTRTR